MDEPTDALDHVFVLTASGDSTKLGLDLARATVLDLKRLYCEARGVPLWQQRFVFGTKVLENDTAELASYRVNVGDRFQMVAIQNLSDLPGLGSGWVLYMFNGRDAQHKDSLAYGCNPQGCGDPGVVLRKSADLTGFYKMNESVFDKHGFTEVAAVGSDETWVLIRRADNASISAAEAFKTGSSPGYLFTFSNGFKCDSRTNRTNASMDGMHWARFGPFFDDVAYNNVMDGSGWQWMWAEEREDKGTIFGSANFAMNVRRTDSHFGEGYGWAWYGRSCPDDVLASAECSVNDATPI